MHHPVPLLAEGVDHLEDLLRTIARLCLLRDVDEERLLCAGVELHYSILRRSRRGYGCRGGGFVFFVARGAKKVHVVRVLGAENGLGYGLKNGEEDWKLLELLLFPASKTFNLDTIAPLISDTSAIPTKTSDADSS